MRRIRGAINSYRFARGFRVGVVQALYRAARYLVTGRTGKFRLPPP